MAAMQRRRVPELMDAADVDPTEHRRALAGLRRINTLSGAARTIATPIIAFARDHKLERLRILDVASGDGDVPIRLALALRARSIEADLTLFDQSDVGLAEARDCAAAVRVSLQTFTGNAFAALPMQDYDVVTCSLFLHHLDREQCVAALSQMKAASRGLIVVSDLRRCCAGLFAAQIGCRLLSRSRLVHHDGPASVRGAWTPEELHDLARHAGLDGASIRRCFPWRMLLTHRFA